MTPLRFAANLSFLFAELPFPERFAGARAAGFAAVEFHFPYAWPSALLAEVVLTSGVEVVLFNLPAGDWARGERGLACDPARRAEFHAGVETAITYARALGTPQLNCLVGIPPAGLAARVVHDTVVGNLRAAAERCAQEGIGLLIEPLNCHDNPGFHLATSSAALALLDAVAHPNLRLQYDLYHAQLSEGNLLTTLRSQLARIGHIQIADVPGRHEPGSGEINFPFVLGQLAALDYPGWIGCEFHPRTPLNESLASLDWRLPWLQPTP